MLKNRTRIFLALSIAIAVIDGLFVYMNSVFMEEALHKSQQQEGQRLHASFDTLISQTYVNMLSMATFIANDEKVQALFLAGKKAVEAEGGGAGGEAAAIARQALFDKVGPNWADVQKKFKVRQLHFHLGPGSTSFLRVHRREKFGDNMDNVRFTIVDTNSEHTSRIGFETGRVYSGLRGVVPVSAWDPELGRRVHVGALEVGTSFSMLLNILDDQYNTGVGILLTQRHLNSAMWPDFIKRRFSDGVAGCDCVIEASSRDGFEEIVQEYLTKGFDFEFPKTNLIVLDGHSFSVNHFPLRDYLGIKEVDRDKVGTVVFWSDADAQMAAHYRSNVFSIIYGVIVFFLIEIFLFFAFRYATRHLENEVDKKTIALRKQEAHLKDAQRIALLGNWEWDLTDNKQWWSDEIFHVFGLDPQNSKASYEAFLSCIHPDDRALVTDNFEEAIKEGQPFNIEHYIKQPNGKIKCVHAQAEVIRDSQGKALKMLGTMQDISERKSAERQLELAASVFSHAREGIAIADEKSNFIMVNKAFTEITGYSSEEVLGKNPSVLSSGRHGPEFYKEMWGGLLKEGYWSGEIWNRHKSGEVYPELITISAVKDKKGVPQHFVALFSDITAQKAHQKHLEHVAHYDVLTGLPNGLLLTDRLNQALKQATRHDQKLAIVYLDLDGFKAVNDTHGHDVGDKLLMASTQRMKESLREGDTIARIGGDEFVVLLADLVESKDCIPLLNRLLDNASESVHIGDHIVQVTASLGVTLYPQDDDVSVEQLLRQADQAMYQAKLAGKNRYHLFDAEHDRNIRGHHESLEIIRNALHNEEFVMYYQPKVNMREGTVIGVEALIRWQHPQKGLLSPAVFLPVIENDLLEIELGEWVINKVLSQQIIWKKVGLSIPVSVNVGALQLQHVDFVERLKKIIATYPNMEPYCLEIEILESSALDDLSQVTEVMRTCSEIGVDFALDDFGTGYASLSYFKYLPVSMLKVDQSFVRDMLFEPDDLAILEVILGLAKAFRRKVIAEGIESIEHGEILLQLGCELGQGYVIARPMPAEELPEWIATWQPDPSWLNREPVEPDSLALIYVGVELRAWVREIKEYLQGELAERPILNSKQCHFSLWLKNKGRACYGEQVEFKTIESLHQQLLLLAESLLQGQPENLEAGFLKEVDSRADEILKQLKKLHIIIPISSTVS